MNNLTEVDVRLPKQWLHWCKSAGLKPHYGGQRNSRLWTLKGHGRLWRVNCYGHLDISCLIEDFDRWANSRVAGRDLTHVLFKNQFIRVVTLLLKDTENNSETLKWNNPLTNVVVLG